MLHWIYTHVPPWAVIALVSHLAILGTIAYLILLERKVASWAQDRLGPNRVGLDFGILPFKFLKRMFGLGQPLADGLKFVLKEDYKPKGVDSVLFTIAPAMMIVTVILSIAVLPWGGVKRTTMTVDVTDVEAATEVERVRSQIPAGVDLVGQRQVLLLQFELDPKPGAAAAYNAPGTKAWATYELTNAAGQAVRYTRLVDIAGYNDERGPGGKDPQIEAVKAKLPPGAVLVAAKPGTDVTQTVTVPGDIRLVNENGVFRSYADVTYEFPFAAGRLNIGVLYIVAVLSLAVYGVVVGGWASNNKFSFLGGLRATANMISYEIPLGLTILCVALMYGSLDLFRIVDGQAGYWLGVIPAWNVFAQPLAFVLFVVCIHAEANRAPFDTAEAEQELVGGYHTEYSAMRFALFFLAEYAGMITTSAVCVALFLGGWHLPWVDYLWPALSGNVAGADPSVTDSLLACFVRAGVFFGKTLGIIFLFMWVRWSLPRFRFDQVMILAWRALIPISLALMMATAIAIYWTAAKGPVPTHLPLGEAAALLAANLAVGGLTMLVSRFLPAPAATNRRLPLPRSRFRNTPLPGKPVEAMNVAMSN